METTNLIERVMARREARTERVDRWQPSHQKLRWCSAALSPVEAQFRRVKGYDKLPSLVNAQTSKITLSTDAAVSPVSLRHHLNFN